MYRKLSNTPDDSVVTVSIDGQSVLAERGESVAAVLLRESNPTSRTTPRSGSPRAPYCMMGVCFECLAIVDGVPSTQTCLTVVHDGMSIERQHGRRSLPSSGSSRAGAESELTSSRVPS